MAQIKVNKHFEFIHKTWDFKVMLAIGSYGSGKSHEVFTKIAIKAATEKRKMMVVRKEFTTLKESCFSDLEDAFERIGQWNKFKFTTSPLQIHGRNGTRIIFRGLDKVRKIKSIKDIDLIVVEEADEISLAELKELINRLRTSRVKTHIIFMCNPVSRRSSIFKYFFVEKEFDEEELYERQLLIKEIPIENPETKEIETMKMMVHHSTYKNNRFLPGEFIYNLENEKDPRIRRIACEGKFGADGELVLYNACGEKNVYERYVEGKIDKNSRYRGIDWGFSTSYTCGLKMAVNEALNELYIYWEYYKRETITKDLFVGLSPLKEGNINIYADPEESKAIADFYNEGYYIFGAKKGGGSRAYYEQMLRSFSRIVIDRDRCPNTLKEAEDCVYKEQTDGEKLPGQYNIDPHSFDAAKYGLSEREYTTLKEKTKKWTSS